MANKSFYIARRYLLAKKGSSAVTFITGLAVFAMAAAVAAMLVIISVFSGLEDLNRDMVNNLHPDITISDQNGKVIQDGEKILSFLKKNKEVASFSKIIEEKAVVSYKNISEIAYLRGVDSAYTSINPVHDNIFIGTYPSYKYVNEIAVENSLISRLGVPVGSTQDHAVIYMPKAGKGIISKQEDIFNSVPVSVSGAFSTNDQLENYIFSPLELLQQLLNLPKSSFYQIAVKLKNPESADIFKNNFLKIFGKTADAKTKEEENAALWKMINTEKVFVYLIFALVILITTFNLAGAIIILQLDKKEQARSLVSLGYSQDDLRYIYFYTGLLIMFFGIVSGLVIGTLACVFQQYTGVFKAGSSMPYPVKIIPLNYLVVAFSALFFGSLVSWFFSKLKKDYLTNN